MIRADFTSITDNAEKIISSIRQEPIEVYKFISDRYKACNPMEDHLFQFVFRTTYRIDNAGLTDEFKSKYFEIFSTVKSTNKIDIPAIIFPLREITNKKGHYNLQFSFATKLANTVNPAMPIYDAEVAKVFGFNRPPSTQKINIRLSKYMQFYNWLHTLYNDIIKTNELRKARDIFKEAYRPTSQNIPDIKILDFIFWAAGKNNINIEYFSDAKNQTSQKPWLNLPLQEFPYFTSPLKKSA